MKKKTAALIVAAAIIVAAAVGGTWAWLTSASLTLDNTFTSGNVEITLQETTGDRYIMTPGVTLQKDPVVTVKAGSVKNWLFVQLERTSDFDMYMTYEMADGWTLLAGHPGVYYRVAEKGKADVSYPVLKWNAIVVKADLTEEQLAAITTLPRLTVFAAAIQYDGMETASIAWNTILSERGSNA